MIEVLNLEDAAIRRGLLEDSQSKKLSKRLEWLDLEGLTERIIKDVDFRDWSTHSFDSNRIINSKNPTPNGNQNAFPDCMMDEKKKAATTRVDKDKMVAQVEQDLSTPKRKLSPDECTPIGRQRKLSTRVFSSPLLRRTLEMNFDENDGLQTRGAPDLISGIGLLIPRQARANTGEIDNTGNSPTQSSPVDDMARQEMQTINVTGSQQLTGARCDTVQSQPPLTLDLTRPARRALPTFVSTTTSARDGTPQDQPLPTPSLTNLVLRALPTSVSTRQSAMSPTIARRGTPQEQTPPSLISALLTLGCTRQRALSVASATRRNPRKARRRVMSNSTPPVAPTRQLRITEIFIKQDNEQDGDTKPEMDAYECLNPQK